MAKLLTKKKKALRLLDGLLSKGATVAAGIEAVTTAAAYTGASDADKSWRRANRNTMVDIFDKDTITSQYADSETVIDPSQELSLLVAALAAAARTEVNRIQTARNDVASDMYEEQRTTLEYLIDLAKRNKIISITLFILVILMGALGIISQVMSVWLLFKPKPNSEEIRFSDLELGAAFMKEDSTYEPELKEDELRSIVGDNIKVVKDGAGSGIILKFVFTDPQLKGHVGFRFHFGLDFYKQLGGDKLYPDGWHSDTLGADNKSYLTDPGTFGRYLSFQTTYNGKK